MKLCHKFFVLFIGGLRIVIIAEAQLFKAILKFLMVLVADFLRRFSLFFCSERHGRPVTVAARNETNVILASSVIPCKHISRQQRRYMSDMQ